MSDKNPLVVLGLGDFSYANSEECWTDIANPLLKKMKVTLGNHDMIPLSKISQLVNAFNLKLPWYSFDLGNVHFVTLSSEFSVNYNGPQYRFVEKDLVHAKSNGSKWIVVFVHKPSYTSKSTHGPLRGLAVNFHPIFHKYGVDLVINAHNHFYERTYPLIPGNDQKPQR